MLWQFVLRWQFVSGGWLEGVMVLRDVLLRQLQLHGRQSAKELAWRTGRNEKLVMRLMNQLAGQGIVVFEKVPEVRVVRLRGWGVRRSVVRYYQLPLRSFDRDPWQERWVKQ